MQRNEEFIGVDVSKETLDVAMSDSKEHLRIANGSEGFKQLQAWLKLLQIWVTDCWFVLEYTGGSFNRGLNRTFAPQNVFNACPYRRKDSFKPYMLAEGILGLI
jgi:hypothetical protein